MSCSLDLLALDFVHKQDLTTIMCILKQVKAVVDEKREEQAIDCNLDSFPVEEVNQVFCVALTCLESEPSKRPTMAEVLKMLEEIKSNKHVS